MFSVIIQEVQTTMYKLREKFQVPEQAISRFYEILESAEAGEQELVILKFIDNNRWIFRPVPVGGSVVELWNRRDNIFTGEDERPNWQLVSEYIELHKIPKARIENAIYGTNSRGKKYPPKLVKYKDWIKFKNRIYIDRKISLS